MLSFNHYNRGSTNHALVVDAVDWAVTFLLIVIIPLNSFFIVSFLKKSILPLPDKKHSTQTDFDYLIELCMPKASFQSNWAPSIKREDCITV